MEMYVIEVYRIGPNSRPGDALERINHPSGDLEAAKEKAKAVLRGMNRPDKPDGVRLLDGSGVQVFNWSLWDDE